MFHSVYITLSDVQLLHSLFFEFIHTRSPFSDQKMPQRLNIFFQLF